ncbi:TetR/AcrR family transcriptional regulator [Donghicola mangrovi]|uniref:TetR/AcrR family transcriptional regulator n=1 Tax=Donghicola mangrovi TaxID=2729614 RepID=A0A850QDU3_9RHOB|nr:TetR/AcrR family transcriptional regulator [Donghicola mangrovi]NVO24319.1 TetR/AcrR family transcriptional regulator [Donghicola mangrovi]
MSTDPTEKDGSTTARGRPKAISADQRRDRILTAAMAVFIEKGFGRSTMADIARQGGMSKRDLYALFDDKTALFSAVVLSRRDLILKLPRPKDEALPLMDVLRSIFRLDLDDQSADERDALLNLISRESLVFPELNAMLYDTGIIRSREALMEWLDEQMTKGVLPRNDLPMVAGLLMDVVFGALLPRRKRQGKVNRTAQAEEILDRIAIVLRGLRT